MAYKWGLLTFTNHLLNGMILQVCFVEPKGPPPKIIRSIIQVDSNARIVRYHGCIRMNTEEMGFFLMEDILNNHLGYIKPCK